MSTKLAHAAAEVGAATGVATATVTDWLPPLLSMVATALACLWYMVMIGQWLHGLIPARKKVAPDKVPEDPTNHLQG